MSLVISERSPRRAVPAVALLLVIPTLVLGAVGLSAAPAHAAGTPLVVIGTSDVFDSQLVQNVIEPGFEAAHPEYDFQYISKGTGDAINLAKTGAGAAILVHAASLENQFVAQGYSAEGYGRAFTYGDFVLAGRSSDAAGVAPGGNPSHDIVDAFQKIAAAGAMGKAEFVSRGGTPGTTVQEHAIWALTSGVTLCDVPADKGGGKTPSTTTGPCPATVSLPGWYHATGANQALNVQNADACNGYASTECYVFTDRGTFNFLESTTPTPTIANLKILVRDNSAAAVGGPDILINNFHAYAVDPAKFPDNPGKTDLAGATKLLDFLVSPSTQQAIDSYLSTATGGSPFKKSARPVVTVAAPVTQVVGGRAVTISGTIANAVPGTLPLSGEKVKLLGVLASSPNAAPTLLAEATTGAQGQFRFSYTPRASLSYRVTTDPITKIQRPDLTPVFGDVLQPTSTGVGTVEVLARLSRQAVNRVGPGRRTLRVQGKLFPTTIGSGAALKLFVRRPGATTFTQRKSQSLPTGRASYLVDFVFGQAVRGRFDYQLRYVNPGVLTTGSTRTYQVKFT